MHIIWRGQFRFQILVSPIKGEQVKLTIDPPKLEVNAGESPFLIEGPGEYEIKDIFIQGIASFYPNTIYTIDAEEMRLCHLGDFNQKELTPEQLDKMGDIDILLVPAGASKIVSQIEPRIVIPTGEGISKFLKAMGRKTIAPQPKILIKKKDLPKEETKVIVLKP